MAALDAEELERFAEQVDRVDRIARALPAAVHSGGTGHANISVNAGGLGVWVAMTCCLVMLAVNVLLVVILVNHDRKIDDLNSYLTAIYMMAPHLKPPDKSQDRKNSP